MARLYLFCSWLLLLLTAAAVAAPSVALCDMQQFIPRIIDYDGELDVTMAGQSHTNTSAGTRASTTDTSALEQLKLTLSGYVYHPTFITFLATGSAGLLQDQFINNGVAAPWTNSDANEYSLTVHVLPEKPYTLNLLTSRTESYAVSNAFNNIRPVIYLNSANFYYHEIPVSFSAGYTDTKTVSDTTTDSSVFNVTASHGLSYYFTSVGYSSSDTSSNTGTDYTQDIYSVSNYVQLNWLLLSSEFKYDNYKQDDPSETINGSDLSWLEELHLMLPLRFESDLTYNRTESSTTSEALAAPAASAPLTQSNANNVLNELLSHRLGESVLTSYAYNYTTNNSSGGQSDSKSNSMAALYTKKVPGGTLTAGVNDTVMTTDNVGSVITLNESHTAPADGITPFNLNPGLIDPATIVVNLVAPGTGFIFPLFNNVNYLVKQIGNTFNITIQPFLLYPIAGFTPNSDINFAYTFNVTYSGTQGTFGLKTTTTGYNVGLALFNNLLIPYYNHQQSGQVVVSGFFPGELSSYTTNTVGTTIQKAPFRFLMEYQKYDSIINPNRVWKSRLDFWENVAQSLSLSAGVFYNKSNILQSQSSAGVTSPYTAVSRGVSVSVHKIFPWNLQLSGSGSYGDMTGLTSSDSYSLNGTLSWKVGRLSVDLQVTEQNVSTLANNMRQATASTLYLLRIRRKLF